MPSPVRQNTGNPALAVVRGGRYAERPARIFTTGEIRLDVDYQQLAADVRRSMLRPERDRDFWRATNGETWPWRLMARYIVRAARRGASDGSIIAFAERMVEFAQYACRYYRNDRSVCGRRAA